MKIPIFQRNTVSVRDTRQSDEIQNRVVSPWWVPLLGWHAGRPAGPSSAKRRARVGEERIGAVEETATAESPAAAAGAAAAAEWCLTLMHDVEIKRRRWAATTVQCAPDSSAQRVKIPTIKRDWRGSSGRDSSGAIIGVTNRSRFFDSSSFFENPKRNAAARFSPSFTRSPLDGHRATPAFFARDRANKRERNTPSGGRSRANEIN